MLIEKLGYFIETTCKEAYRALSGNDDNRMDELMGHVIPPSDDDEIVVKCRDDDENNRS